MAKKTKPFTHVELSVKSTEHIDELNQTVAALKNERDSLVAENRKFKSECELLKSDVFNFRQQLVVAQQLIGKFAVEAELYMDDEARAMLSGDIHG